MSHETMKSWKRIEAQAAKGRAPIIDDDVTAEVLDVLSEQIERAYECGQLHMAAELEYCYRELQPYSCNK